MKLVNRSNLFDFTEAEEQRLNEVVLYMGVKRLFGDMFLYNVNARKRIEYLCLDLNIDSSKILQYLEIFKNPMYVPNLVEQICALSFLGYGKSKIVKTFKMGFPRLHRLLENVLLPPPTSLLEIEDISILNVYLVNVLEGGLING